MEIKYTREPVVGETFEFSVIDYAGTARVAVHAANTVLKQNKCPDPPCHEKLAILVVFFAASLKADTGFTNTSSPRGHCIGHREGSEDTEAWRNDRRGYGSHPLESANDLHPLVDCPPFALAV
ncbi:MAG: hypothetical protein QOC81_2927 [Thermoanaerobaculia bacterium]|jgi:hypothetical protein|nr:hypothetical protein [Thermoanaerobaculia bacterium]